MTEHVPVRSRGHSNAMKAIKGDEAKIYQRTDVKSLIAHEDNTEHLPDDQLSADDTPPMGWPTHLVGDHVTRTLYVHERACLIITGNEEGNG
jgi:hypothetical protein